ncbi:MAG TPA: S8 family serine peptidase, partial [Vicinamibacterales bacterium]
MSPSSRRTWARVVLTVALALLAVTDSATQVRSTPLGLQLKKLDGILRADVDRQSSGVRRVIVRVRPGERSALRRLMAAQGESVLAEHPSVDALTAIVPAEDLEWLAQQGSVLSVSADAVVRPHGQILGLLKTVTDTVGGLAAGTVGTLLDTVGSIIDPGMDEGGEPVTPAVLRATLGLSGNWTGAGVGVAVIDSGLEMSSEFSGRVTAFYDFTNGRTAAVAAFDDYGHGTHVAGTIAGSGALSFRREHRGLAPAVDLVVLKVLDANGSGYTSDVIRAVDFAVANRDRFGIDIINLSLGHPIYEPASTDPLVQAVERASRAGIVVIAAAGTLGTNPTTGLPGYAGITSPGNAPSAITVGALATSNTVARDDDRIPDYSSAGPTWYDALVKPDLL